MSTKKKLTAVEWLVEHFKEYGFRVFVHEIEIQQAKELEKQQIIDTWNHAELRVPKEMKHINSAEQYYNEIFKNDNRKKNS